RFTFTIAQPYLSAISVHRRFTSSYVPRIRTIVGPKISEPRTFPSSRSCGIITKQRIPAAAACAAVLLARLPVDAQPTVSKPNSTAELIATETTRSLYEYVG